MQDGSVGIPQAPVVETTDSATTHWINHYSEHKCQENQLRYSLDG